MKYMNKFYDTGSIEKDFSWKGKVFSERVAKYPKILYKGLIPSGQKSGAILYPGGKKNLFSLRIDVDEVDEHDRVTDHDPGQGNHADHSCRSEEGWIGVTANRATEESVQQPETRHDADQCERDRQHDEQWQQT